MSIFGFFKKKTTEKPQGKEETKVENHMQRGIATSNRIEIDSRNQDSIRNCFIAFDVETTGLSPTFDRIVEIGAVIFFNGTVQKVFSSLVNPGVSIPQSASAVNHITNTMLATAPTEKEIYPRLIDFLGDALCGKIVMCAHNGRFDFDFLCNTLSRLGYSANIKYVDTLSLSRKKLQGLDNYKQNTIEKYFGLVNSSSHRAASDAENCGYILLRLLQKIERKADEKAKQKTEKKTQKEAAISVQKQSRGKAILQMDGDGNIIKEFDTIAAAVREVGVSSKCIRNAANGVQKRAGGYRWRYKE